MPCLGAKINAKKKNAPTVAAIIPVVLAMLVVACPCALALGTPTALASAARGLAAGGVLTASSDALERLARITHVVLDKTGTLTRPGMRVAEVRTAAGLDRDALVGTWIIKEEITGEEIMKNSGGKVQLPPGMSMSIAIDGSQTYAADGTGTSSGTLINRISAQGQTQEIAFAISEEITWELDGDVIVETIVSGSAEPANDFTRQAAAANPQVLAQAQPKAGKVTRTTILALSDTEITTRAGYDNGFVLELTATRQP